jgi:mannose-6-phosphate isomerase-like protein (cupin superfamily)
MTWRPDGGYVTLDGSRVAELLHPDSGGPETYSVALAIVEAGQTTRLHHHETSREVYLFIEGAATVEVGLELVSVTGGDTVAIPAGTPHRIGAGAEAEVHLLCVCRPPYRHEDTILVGEEPDGD